MDSILNCYPVGGIGIKAERGARDPVGKSDAGGVGDPGGLGDPGGAGNTGGVGDPGGVGHTGCCIGGPVDVAHEGGPPRGGNGCDLKKGSLTFLIVANWFCCEVSQQNLHLRKI